MYLTGNPYLSKHPALKPLVLQDFHSSPVGGHVGISKTFPLLKIMCFWEGMRKDVAEFVSACTTSQQPPFSLLQPITPPTTVWEDLAMDFITGLPAFSSTNSYIVVVDRFSKVAHFGTLPSHFSAFKAAELVTQMISKLHGHPRSIISDRDPIFISKIWQTLFHLNGPS